MIGQLIKLEAKEIDLERMLQGAVSGHPILAARHELLLRLLLPGLWKQGWLCAATEHRRGGHPLEDQIPPPHGDARRGAAYQDPGA
jgi:hypothetical protein